MLIKIQPCLIQTQSAKLVGQAVTHHSHTLLTPMHLSLIQSIQLSHHPLQINMMIAIVEHLIAPHLIVMCLKWHMVTKRVKCTRLLAQEHQVVQEHDRLQDLRPQDRDVDPGEPQIQDIHVLQAILVPPAPHVQDLGRIQDQERPRRRAVGVVDVVPRILHTLPDLGRRNPGLDLVRGRTLDLVPDQFHLMKKDLTPDQDQGVGDHLIILGLVSILRHRIDNPGETGKRDVDVDGVGDPATGLAVLTGLGPGHGQDQEEEGMHL